MNGSGFLVAALLVARVALAAEPAASAAKASSAEVAAPASAPASASAAPATPTASAGPKDMARTEQPRSFGHVLGDVLTQRVLLEHGGRALTPATLPPADRVGRWFERRTPRIEADTDGRRWLVIDYQLINAPRTLTAIALPALALATTGGPLLGVPAWPVSIAPLTGPEAITAGSAWPLQPDRPVESQPIRPIERQLQGALAGLTLVLVGWLGWFAWRQWREARSLPFAHALQQMRRLDAAEPAAWQALHQALNRSAGHVVHSASLGRLLEQAPHLQPLRNDLEAFFAASNARFFGAAPAAPAFLLLALARALHAAERRHQR